MGLMLIVFLVVLIILMAATVTVIVARNERRFVCLVVLCIALLLSCHMLSAQRGIQVGKDIILDKREYAADVIWLDEHVRLVGSLAHEHIEDVDSNNIINCVDYAVTFKRAHDMITGSQQLALLVWNKSKTMNHLFVAIRRRNSNVWYNIEPKVAMMYGGNVSYMMGDAWTETEYNPLYNVYDRYSWLWNKSLDNNW